MKKIIFSLVMFFVLSNSIYAQKYFTRAGKVSFTSDAPLEKIEAINNSATSVLDLENGRMEFAVLIKAFQFEKALMQEHFNENYMESGKYPKAIFKGKIADLSKINFSQNGNYDTTIIGVMTIHGVDKEIEVPGKFFILDGNIKGEANFELLVEDFKIDIPSVVNQNIAEKVEVMVDIEYELFEKKS